ncbi:hypothetical protein GCM10027051_24370 [Niabella terrae]
MKRILIILLVVLFFVPGTHAAVAVRQLLVEQQSFPIGIGTARPRFSWQLHSDQRNIRQVAYEILVASSRSLLERNRGDLWSSGKITGDGTVLVPYDGKPLLPNTYYYVKVRTYTNHGDAVWSTPAFFTLGLLRTEDWKARWIGYEHPFPWDSISQWSRLSARYFRKEFKAGSRLKKAFAHIVGLGMYELRINGEKIGDQVLAPAPTDYRKTVLSNTFDVTETIISGENAIGVVLGNGRFFTMRQQYKPHKINNFGFPRLLFQLELIYEDGRHEQVLSDESWKFTADGPVRSNNEYDGEIYDARKELGDWSRTRYDERGWRPVENVPAPAGNITPQPQPPMKIMDRIKPKQIKQLKPGVYIMDMGQNFSGWLQIRVRGKRGDAVQLRFAESLQADGSLYLANLRDARVTDTYILNGKGQEEWHPQFVYHGFRYVEITGWPGQPQLSDFEGQLVYDQMATTGTFQCSDATLTQLVQNAWWGIASNYKGMPVDCPQRNERQPWLGDRAQGAYGESFLFNNAALYAKWLDDIQDAQTEEGAIPDVAPAFWNYYSDNITWPGTYLLVAEMLYQQYGDRSGIVKHYASMKKWMWYMRDKYLKEFIMTRDKYGDWCVPPEDLKMIRSQDSTRTTKGPLLATAYYYHFLEMMSRFAEISGQDADIQEYRNLAEKISAAFNQRFFRPETGQYDNGTVTANLLPLYFGMVADDKRQAVFDHIIRKLESDNWHISTGVIGTQWLMRGLTRWGRSDIAFRLASNRSYPSWGYMIANGATTIWELWNGNTANPQMNSQNHVMLLGDLLIWIFEDLAGIQAAAPGFGRIHMQPAFQKGQSVKASYQSVHGEIRSEWQQQENHIDWKVDIPANTTAVLEIPVAASRQLLESGHSLKAAGIRILKEDATGVRLEVGSGNYHFVTK